MARSKLVQRDSSDEEGMDAVLFHNKERRRQHRRSKGKYGSDDESSGIFESSQDKELLDLVQRKKWETVLYRILKEPNAAFVTFTGRSSGSPSAGNLLLHEVCKKNPPMDIIEALIDSNEKAAMTKGNSGYLPFHYACAHGASIQLIRLLLSLNPEAIRAVDEEEGILPLHLACRFGVTKEDVYMCLLTAFPESSMIRDHYGRLPMDYARSIRSDSHRKIAIECLKRATWLEAAAQHAREYTEADFHQRIKGYEQSQSQQLKMIEEVHTKEIADLEAKLESKDEELAERSHDLEELDKHLQEMTDEFRQRVESTDKATKAKNRMLQGQLDKAKEDAIKTKEDLELRDEEVGRLSLKLDEARHLNDSLKEQLQERTEELDLALDDIDTMTKHTEWLKSVKDQIKDLVTSESPLLQESSKKDSTKKSKRSASKKSRSSRSVSSKRSEKGKRSPSVSSRRSEKGKRSPSVSSRRSEKLKRSTSYRISPENKESPFDEETRDASFASSRIISSHRE